MSQRIRTKYPGVFYREARRIGFKGLEKVYYIVFKKDGRVIEEKVGRQYVDGMTAAKAATVRGERIERKRKSRKEIKAAKEAELKAQQNRWTFDRLWEEYKLSKPEFKSVVQDENRYKNHIKPIFGNKEPKQISHTDIDTLRKKLLGSYMDATVKGILALLRRLTIFGETRQLCEGMSFKIKMPKVNNRKIEVLTPEQLSRLNNVLDNEKNTQVANIMRMALLTGMRRGELLKLKWEDIDFQSGFIHLREPKGGTDQMIPMNEQVRNILNNHIKTDSPYVFPGRNGKPRTSITPQANKIKKKAGLPDNFRALHGLRHVFASLLASTGKVDMYTLQKLLTHKSPTMTQRYAHLHDEALKKASELAGDLIEEHMLKKTDEEKNEDKEVA